MQAFIWLALTTQGHTQRGTLYADNLQQLEQQLLQQQLYLIEAKPQQLSARKAAKIKRQELVFLFNNLQQLCAAGVPLLESLAELAQICRQPLLQQTLQQIQRQIETGASLSQAMAQHPHIFDSVICCLVEVGEQSGELPSVFEWIAQNLQWQDEMRSHTRQLLLYPCFVGIMIVIACLFLMLHLVPQLTGLIQSLGMPLPLHTQVLMGLSQGLQQYGWLLLLLLTLPPIALQQLCKRYPNLACRRDAYLLQLWIIGPLVQQITLARFTQAIALMYRAGINTLHCLQLARGLVTNRQLKQALDQALQHIEAGQSLSRSFQQTGLFPSLLIRMLRVGETTGGLDQALLQISRSYDQEIRQKIKQLQVLIEPCMTIILGLLLAWVVLAVLAPLYDLIGNLPL